MGSKNRRKEITYSIICLIPFTYLGVLVRLSLSMLSDYASDTLLPRLGSGFFLANIYGSFVMGLIAPLVDFFHDRSYWHVAMASGFCGSCTTFATWQKITADGMIRGWIVDSILMSLITFTTSYMALLFGRHWGNGLAGVFHRRRARNGSWTIDERRMVSDTPAQSKSPPPTFHPDVGVVLVLDALLTAGLWVGVFMDPVEWRRRWWISMALGPIGSLVRYSTSLFNKNYPKFPVFTFLVNIVASVLATMFLVIEHFLGTTRSAGTYEFWVMNGISVGMLGSLSTVSTFVNELYKFGANDQIWNGYKYGLASFVVAQALCVLVGCVTFFK